MRRQMELVELRCDIECRQADLAIVGARADIERIGPDHAAPPERQRDAGLVPVIEVHACGCDGCEEIDRPSGCPCQLNRTATGHPRDLWHVGRQQNAGVVAQRVAHFDEGRYASLCLNLRPALCPRPTNDAISRALHCGRDHRAVEMKRRQHRRLRRPGQGGQAQHLLPMPGHGNERLTASLPRSWHRG
jgi:hypothetical protein